MPLQPIDTSTDHGTYKGDPAKTAFTKVNANDQYLEGLATSAQNTANAAYPRSGGALTGSAVMPGLYLGSNTNSPYLYPENTGDLIVRAYDGSTAAYFGFYRNGNFRALSGSILATAFSSNQNFQSISTNVVLASLNGSAGTVILRPNGVGSTAGQAVLNAAGTLSVVALTQTSSFDVKTHLEGYTGDAESQLDRLVIVTHKYRKDFLDDGGLSHISFVAENVRDVFPLATSGGYTEVVSEPYDAEVQQRITVPSEEDPEVLVELDVSGTETRWREVENVVPLSIQPVPLLAILTRAHQQRGRRIEAMEQRLRSLEDIVASLQAIIQTPNGADA